MKITKEELVRIIREEVKNKKTKVNKKTKPVKYTVQPVEYPTSTGKTDAADNIEELYRSVYGLGDSVMQISARIDGIEKVIKELDKKVQDLWARRSRPPIGIRSLIKDVLRDYGLLEFRKGDFSTLRQQMKAMYLSLPEDLQADIRTEYEELTGPTEFQKAHGIVPDENIDLGSGEWEEEGIE